MTETVAGVQEASKTRTTNTTNNSNAVLGGLFSIGEDKLTSFNPINKTYTKLSYVGNRTIIPPDAATATINATERGNLRLISNRMVLVLLKRKAFL